MSAINTKSSVFSLSQGSKFQEKKNNTLGSFSSLKGADNVPSTFSIFIESNIKSQIYKKIHINHIKYILNSYTLPMKFK